MTIPIRADAEFGLTAPQFAMMPDRLRKKAEALEASGEPDAITEAKRLKDDIVVWERAAEEVNGRDGRFSIVWAKVKEDDLEEVDDEENGAPTFDAGDDEDLAEDDEDDEAASRLVGDAKDLIEAAFAEVGRRNSAADLSSIQSAHDTLVKLGAACGHMKESLIEYESDSAEPMTFHESGWGEIEQVTIAEADPEFDREKREVWITPIRPGPGNKRDRMYYPERTVREAVEAGRFNNIKMFANHPRKSDERELPERSVRDWVGVIKETVWDEKRSLPRSRLKVLDKDVYERFEAAPEHIAFSVLGGGRARPGRVNGETRRIVESMDKVRSVDWVTEAGAGGAIDFAESADEEFEMDLADLTVEQVREGNPALFAAIREDGEPVAEEATLREGDEEQADEAAATPEKAEAAEPEKAVKDEPKAKAGGSGEAKTKDAAPAPDGYVSKDDYDALLSKFDAVSAKVEKMEAKEAEAEALDHAEDIVTDRLRKTILPRSAREYVMARFAEATVGEGFAFEDEERLIEAVDAEIEAISKVSKTNRPNLVKGLGDSDEEDSPMSLREAKEASIAERLGDERMPDPRRNDGEEGNTASDDTSSAGSWAERV